MSVCFLSFIRRFTLTVDFWKTFPKELTFLHITRISSMCYIGII